MWTGSSVSWSYATGEINGVPDNTGGLIGYIIGKNSLENSYFNGHVINGSGLIGFINFGSTTNDAGVTILAPGQQTLIKNVYAGDTDGSSTLVGRVLTQSQLNGGSTVTIDNAYWLGSSDSNWVGSAPSDVNVLTVGSLSEAPDQNFIVSLTRGKTPTQITTERENAQRSSESTPSRQNPIYRPSSEVAVENPNNQTPRQEIVQREEQIQTIASLATSGDNQKSAAVNVVSTGTISLSNFNLETVSLDSSLGGSFLGGSFSGSVDTSFDANIAAVSTGEKFFSIGASSSGFESSPASSYPSSTGSSPARSRARSSGSDASQSSSSFSAAFSQESSGGSPSGGASSNRDNNEE
jgi:hypothetical protein